MERTDAQLLWTIADERDRQAFQQFFSRHGNACYSLALRICGDVEVAGDALREAMLQVWLSASTFDPSGSARVWALKITARKGFKLSNRVRKLEQHFAEQGNPYHVSVISAPEKQAESSEILRALQSLLDALDESDRWVISLFYGAQCTREEIAEMIPMPLRTVDYRIEKAVQVLRGGLAQAGFSGVVMEKGMAEISIVALSGYLAPENILDRCLRGIFQSTRTNPTCSGTRYLTLKPAWLALAMTLIFAAGSMAGWIVLKPSQASSAWEGYVYRFGDGSLQELRPVTGEWFREPFEDLEEGGGMGAGQSSVGLLLPLMPKPFKVTITYHGRRNPSIRNPNLGLSLAGDNGLLPQDRWDLNPEPIKGMDPAVKGVRTGYVVGGFLTLYERGRLQTVIKAEGHDQARYLFLLTSHALISKIEIRELKASEIRSEWRDPLNTLLPEGMLSKGALRVQGTPFDPASTRPVHPKTDR